MKLEEKHKEFVVKCFARFMTLTEILGAFMEEFEDDLPPPDMSDIPTLDQWMADLLIDEIEQAEKLRFINEFIERNQEEYKEEYGDKANEKLNQEALEEYEFDCEMAHIGYCNRRREEALAKHEKQFQENLFNRFRRLDIDHRQFPDKYKALFHNTRDEFCANYRIPDLNVPENVVRELETLYGFQKQRIFQHRNSKDVMQHITLAHQILKTIIACNAIDAKQEVVDVTPQDAKALKQPQEALTDS